MATQVWGGAVFAEGAVTCDMLFDDVTLLISTVRFTNTSAQACAAHVTGPSFDHTFTWGANAGTGTANVAPFGLHMVASQAPASHGLPVRTVYNLPAGWEIDFQYPA